MINYVNHLNPENYIKYFRTDGLIGCIHSEFILNGPLGRGMLVMNKDLVFYSYISRKREKTWARQGLRLYGDCDNFRQYIKSFKIYIKEANTVIINNFKKPPKNLTKIDFLRAIKFIGILWKKYGFLETQFQEYAYVVAQKTKNKIIHKNLLYASKFKFKAREIMNKYYFRNGVLENIYKYFSKKYKVDATYLYTNEMIDLFDDRRPPKNYLQRNKCYAILNDQGNIIKFSYQDALKIFNRFTERIHQNTIKGICASKGMAIGKAIVVPMFDSHQQIKKIDKIMKKGDILVAETTSPEVLVLCQKAAAIVTNTGGMLSHAAIVSRELKIPCVVNTVNATLSIKNGNMVEVNADQGVVRILKK